LQNLKESAYHKLLSSLQPPFEGEMGANISFYFDACEKGAATVDIVSVLVTLFANSYGLFRGDDALEYK
jgi:hypothetical protein